MGARCPGLYDVVHITSSYRLRRLVGAAFLLLWAAGCSQPKPVEIIPVAGKISYKNRPVARARISLYPSTPGEPAFAISDAQGKFACMTNDASGIPPGEYRVTVTGPSKGTVPASYGSLDTSPLRFTIKAGETNDMTIELKD